MQSAYVVNFVHSSTEVCMPFYEVVGNDNRTLEERTLHISARNDGDAAYTAEQQGIVEVKLRSFSDREMLMMDSACFLYADPLAPVKAKVDRIRSQYPRSILFDHPFLTITGSVFAALMLNRLTGYLLSLL